MSDDTSGRKAAERRIGWSKLFARAKQVLTTDPSGTDDDDQVIDDVGAIKLAAEAGRLKGGLAKVAQWQAYQANGAAAASMAARAALAQLWDNVPTISAATISAVIEKDLGAPPQTLFASWDVTPLAAASLGQVHAATGLDGKSYVVKVQYPAVADALRKDLASDEFARRLAGDSIGRWLTPAALTSLRAAVLAELDYRREADGLTRFAAAWGDDPVLRFPVVDGQRSSGLVLTMTRAQGRPLLDCTSASDELRRAIAAAIIRFSWGSPLLHGIVNADPNPGNFFFEGDDATSMRLWCLDFGGWVQLDPAAVAADRDVMFGLIDDDVFAGAERFRMALQTQGLLLRGDKLASHAHHEWEKLLLAPWRGKFRWTTAYAQELAAAFGRVLAQGGVGLPPTTLMLWRHRLGVAAVLGILDVELDGRALMRALVGSGKKSLR